MITRFYFIPLFNHCISKYSFFSSPPLHNICSICILRNYSVRKTWCLYAKYIYFWINFLSIFLNKLKYITIRRIISTLYIKSKFSIISNISRSSIKASMRRLLVWVDKDIIPVLLVINSLLEELPNATFSRTTNITIMIFSYFFCLR